LGSKVAHGYFTGGDSEGCAEKIMYRHIDKIEIDIIKIDSKNIAVLRSSGIMILETKDALDLLAEASYLNSHKIIIKENQLMSFVTRQMSTIV